MIWINDGRQEIKASYSMTSTNTSNELYIVDGTNYPLPSVVYIY
jgi:hypothetical protein